MLNLVGGGAEVLKREPRGRLFDEVPREVQRGQGGPYSLPPTSLPGAQPASGAQGAIESHRDNITPNGRPSARPSVIAASPGHATTLMKFVTPRVLDRTTLLDRTTTAPPVLTTGTKSRNLTLLWTQRSTTVSVMAVSSYF